MLRFPAFLVSHAPSGPLFTKIRRADTDTSQELDVPCFMPCFFVGLTPSPCNHAMHSLDPSYYQTLPEDRRLLSYNHLLFRPTLVLFPPTGLGVGGGSENRLDAVLRLKELVLALKGLGDPYEDLLPPL